MMLPTMTDTRALHAKYLELTGLSIPFTMSIHFALEVFIVRGYKESDLASVVSYMKNRIRQKRRERESLLPRNLLRSMDSFAEELAMSRAESRKPTHTPKDRILSSTGRPVSKTPDAMPIAQVMEESEKLSSMLKQWRSENNL